MIGEHLIKYQKVQIIIWVFVILHGYLQQLDNIKVDYYFKNNKIIIYLNNILYNVKKIKVKDVYKEMHKLY